ncbi:WD40/YVTN/BNR-like repeat-containing protein [Candidatus Clostridium stratigraminis]|uniref:WD40/YVTN/BNR-like repeat-containing protein n=1 Tax=Candidatus Clostridium stratigraminis TaxID=3381661 RepID=A0ABW8T534_9CLOT
MRVKKQITKSGFILSLISWSIFILVYWISFYEAYTLSRFGRFKNNTTVLMGCMVFFLLWFIILVIRIVKKPAAVTEQIEDEYKFYSRCRTIWNFVIILIIVIITCTYGVKIYHSSINYNGKLSWYLHDLKDKRTVKLVHSHIYESGVEGIFTDINKKVKMPEKLYISSNFTLNFDSEGAITSFDTFLYGKNDKGELKSYLISYNSSKSKNITIYLNGNVNANYNNDKLLEPFIKTMKVIKLKEAVSKWPNEKYGILYSGKRSFGYNTTGIVYIDSKGNVTPAVNAYSEIIGYTVSVYVPGKENVITPIRYNLTDVVNNSKGVEPSQSNGNNPNQYKNNVDEFYLTKQVGFRLEVTGAALGSRAYSLTGTVDSGQTWKTINTDPFSGMLGSAAGITFLNEKLGFLCLSYSGGVKGQLFRTEDGGKSYKKVNFPEVKAVLSSGAEYNPFDLPEMPYEENEIIDVLVGQGADGDYKGGCKVLYQSTDKGITWKYVKEVNK